MVFPAFEGKRAGYVNLAEYASRWLARHRSMSRDNLLLEPAMLTRIVGELHREHRIDYSYGGWLEERGELLRGSYLDAVPEPLHLGVDLNVPAGTLVACDSGGSVLRIEEDTELHGWGGRMFIRLRTFDVVLLYAHLSNVRAFYRVGETVGTKEGFAYVGTPDYNGGWYPHLHVQAMSHETYRCFARERDATGCDPEWFDGYGPSCELAALTERFMDPLPYLKLI